MLDKTGINTEIKNESLRTGTAYIDKQVIWTSDEAVGGLYAINKFTFEMKVILEPPQVFKYEKFKIQSVVQWKDSIILLPARLNQRWVIYDKNKGTTEYRDVVGISGETTGMYIVGKKGFLIPGTTNIPVVIVDLETMTVFRIIKNWDRGVKECSEGFWITRTGVIADKDVFFHLYDTRYLVKIGGDGIHAFEAQIPDGIASLSYSEHEFWVLPTSGNCIYRVDREGRFIEAVDLEINDTMFAAADFVRIVSVERYVFLLPALRKNLCVYDRHSREIFEIAIKREPLKNKLPLLCDTASYWGYCVDLNKLYLMPVENELLEIDTNTLEWKQRSVYLPAFMSGRGLLYWFGWNQWCTKGNISLEWDIDSLGLYFDMIREGNATWNGENSWQGDHIWKEIKK